MSLSHPLPKVVPSHHIPQPCTCKERHALPCPALPSPTSPSTVPGTLPVPFPFQNRTSLDLRKGRSAHRVEEGVLEERSLLKELDDGLDRKVKAKPRGPVPLVEGSLEDSGIHE